jgi:uncharacterized protein (AIM24 family)
MLRIRAFITTSSLFERPSGHAGVRRRGGGICSPLVAIETKLVGGTTQVVVCQLAPGQCVYSLSGRLLWKTASVAITTRVARHPTTDDVMVSGPVPDAGGPARLVRRALARASEVGKRVMPGEAIAFQRYTAEGDGDGRGDGVVAFAGLVPGAMRVIGLGSTPDAPGEAAPSPDDRGFGRNPGRGWVVEQDAFVVAESTADVNLAFSRSWPARRSSERLVLYRFRGEGTVVVCGGGDLLEVNPADHDGRIHVAVGALVGFDGALAYRVERLGGMEDQGPLSSVPGSETLTVVTLEGDGAVLLRAMSSDGMASALARRTAPAGSD